MSFNKVAGQSLQKTFKDFGLEIVAESNLRIINYLDVTLNFNDGSFRWRQTRGYYSVH